MSIGRCAECGEPLWDGPQARVGDLEYVYDVCTTLCAIVLRERLDVGDNQAETIKRQLEKDNERLRTRTR